MGDGATDRQFDFLAIRNGTVFWITIGDNLSLDGRSKR